MQRTLWPIVTRLLAEGPDEVLLERYFGHQDQEAFAQLLTRYNRLVWGQCRNLLANDADAEDAFQATFLTLARSAKRLKAGSPLGPWLHGVAFRVCMNARRVIGRRAKREKASAQPDVQQPVADSSWEKAFAAVAEEVQRLPETQRVAFVLCYLEGRPVAEAAASLGQKLGTFTSRLSRAKQALLDRLAKRGLGVGVLALSGVTGSAVVASAAVVERSLALLPSGVAIPGSVQVLTQGVTGMSLIPFKLLAASVMLITGLGTGASILTHRTLAAGPHEANQVPISQLVAKAPVPKVVTGETSGAAAEIKSDPLKTPAPEQENKPAPKDLGKIQPPGGVPLPLVKPGTNAIDVDQLNKVRTRLEAVPADDLERWVVELERILDEKLKEGVPSARQVCRTDFAIHMSVAFDDLKWNAKTAGDLFRRAQTMPASEAKAWKEAFETLLKTEIGQTDTTNLAGGPAWAVPLVLIPVDALHQGQKYSAERGKKYRARLKQLTADDVSLWKDKVDEFGGTKLDAAVNIILLDDFFDREKFQRDRFKAAIEARKK